MNGSGDRHLASAQLGDHGPIGCEVATISLSGVEISAVEFSEKTITLLRVTPTLTCQDMSRRIFGHILNIF